MNRGRFASVDALRGITVAAMLLVNDPGDWGHVWWPLEHAAWNGCTPTDLVFPVFLFIVGVSVSLAILPRVQAGAPKGPLTHALLVRALRILGLGLLLNVVAWSVIPEVHLRLPGVLQRIALCFAAAALLAVHTRQRTRDIALVLLLVGYGAVLLWGGMAPWTNPASRVDAMLFGSFVYQQGPAPGLGHDPEGLLSTLPALATTLLGMRAGSWLREGRRQALWLGAAACVALGWVLQEAWPFNKNLWTPSYVVWTGGWAFALLALAHQACDRLGWMPIGRAFGVNAIAAYAGSGLMVYALIGAGVMAPMYQHGFASWITPLAGPYVGSAAWGVAFVFVWWLVVRCMDWKGVYLKV